MLKEGAIVTIQGKAKQRVIKQLTSDYLPRENQGWFFIDYAIEEIPLHSKFDVLLEGKSKRLILGPGPFTIKLLTCLDQFGNKLSSVPKGWKTICKFEVNPQLPSALKKLPFLDQWDYNPNAISLVNGKNIELAIPDLILNDLYSIIFIQLKTSFGHKSKQPIYKKDLVDFLKKSFNTPSKSANQILETLMQLGKLTQKDDNEVELSEIEK